MLSLNISYLAYWIKNLLSLKIRIHYTVLNAAGYKLKLLYLSSCISIQLYFHSKLAADIPVAAGFICLTICFHLSLNIYFFSFSVH